ncbi:MAG: class I SAM-dependent methyltransferase [Bacteroidales bacterium]|nr:class I SAM-dependent methyltransferase [Bacteroidales bacterium]
MKSRFIYALKFIEYKLSARHKKGHSIHSPFMYRLIREVFIQKTINPELAKVIDLHKRYKKSRQIISFNKTVVDSEHSISLELGKIIKRSSINSKYGKLLFRLIQFFNSETILEIESSVGISSAYIAQANKKAHFISIESIKLKIEIAKKLSNELNQNTEFIHGNIDSILKSTIDKYIQLDFVFFDGNHTPKNTIKYFELCLTKIHNDSVFVFNDIHWSDEMEKAWEYIRNHKTTKVSVDLFKIGIIFFKQELSSEQYTIKF